LPISNIINKLNENGALDRVIYVPYNIKDTKLFVGIPPTLIIGLDYVFARYNEPRWKRIKGVNGKSRFAKNKDDSGIIEFGIIGGSLSCGVIQLLEELQIPFPISIQDFSSAGTSFVLADSCVRVDTPEWRREATVGLQVYTFETNTLAISNGIRLQEL